MKHLNKRKKKALFVATVVKKHIMEFHIPYLKMFQEMGWETAVAARNDYENPADCVIPYCDRYYDIPFERSPLKGGNIKAYFLLKRLIDRGNYDIVHCHTPVGGILTRFAARDARKKGLKVIYTAHGFHFYKGAPLLNWMLFYPVEWLCSWWTDVLITINKEDYRLAKRRLHAKKMEYVHGVGIDLDKFTAGKTDVEEKRKSLNLGKKDVMLLSVGELSKRKNHEAVIRAVAQLCIPQLKYFICGTGMLKEYLIALINELGMQKQVFLLGYRDDISELCQTADLYIFPSKQEGLPVALMEAIACKTPVLCSDIRGDRDLVLDTNCKFDADSVKGVADCIAAKLRTDSDDMGGNLRDILSKNMKYIVEQNYQYLKKYGLREVTKEMSEIYGGGVMRLWNRKCFEKKYCLGSDALVLLSVGELNKNKNHAVVIRALAEMRNPQIHYFIAGSGKLKTKLEDLSTKLGVKKQVHLLGYRNDVEQLLQIADIYLLPSKREGLNVSLMEAIASKMLVLCSNIRGNKDLIRDADSMFDAESVEAVVKCIANKLEKNSACSTQSSKVRDEIFENTKYIVEENYKSLKNYSLQCVWKELAVIYRR